ncbi:MAG: hypothetical protein GXX91_04295 [Verrucomicrobiaceae bacterium]|nr:hypothetical protein [Verrucomicrobiaceae bacterium]
MNDEIPWAYVAMIFIAFVSWVYGRLKEAAEYRRARAAAKRAAQEARNRARPEPAPSPYRPSAPVSATPPVPVPVAPPEPEPAAEIEMPKTFRELFEMLQEPPKPAPAPAPAPEPAPPSAPAAREETRSADSPSPSPSPSPGALDRSEITRLFPGADRSASTAPPLQVERVRRKASSNLHRILHNRGTLREALILKEILDTPVALQE